MKLYISIIVTFVIALLITATIISHSDKDFQEKNNVEVESIKSTYNNNIVINKENVEIELPNIISTGFIIHHHAYTIAFNSTTLNPNWVAYELTAEETDGPWTRKGLNFIPDPDYDGIQADHSDYKGSGYSRGHLAPAGDMKWDSIAMLESFYYTNCIPQDEALNNGKWNQLENKTRQWAKKYGRVFVLTGPVFYQNDTLRIGPHEVAVPHACFKALLAPTDTGYTAIAFVMKNGEEKRPIKECAITVDELEVLLSLDLFCYLSDEIEEPVESKIIWGDWNIQ